VPQEDFRISFCCFLIAIKFKEVLKIAFLANDSNLILGELESLA